MFNDATTMREINLCDADGPPSTCTVCPHGSYCDAGTDTITAACAAIANAATVACTDGTDSIADTAVDGYYLALDETEYASCTSKCNDGDVQSIVEGPNDDKYDDDGAFAVDGGCVAACSDFHTTLAVCDAITNATNVTCTEAGASVAVTAVDGYYLNGTIPTVCDAITNAATVTCTEAGDSVAATAVDGYYLDGTTPTILSNAGDDANPNAELFDGILNGLQTPVTTTTTAPISAGTSEIALENIDGIEAGDKMTFTSGNVTETGIVKTVTATVGRRRATAGTVTLEEVLVNAFPSGISTSTVPADLASFVKTTQAYFANAPANFDASLLVAIINGDSLPASGCLANCIINNTDQTSNECGTQLELDMAAPATGLALIFDADTAFSRIGRGSAYGCHAAAECLCACDTNTWPALEEGVCATTSSYEYHDGPVFGMLVFVVLVFFFGLFVNVLVQGCRKPAEESGEESAAEASMV